MTIKEQGGEVGASKTGIAEVRNDPEAGFRILNGADFGKSVEASGFESGRMLRAGGGSERMVLLWPSVGA